MLAPHHSTRTTLTRRSLLAGSGAVALTISTGCAGDGDDSPGNRRSAPDEVTYLTGFGASAHDSFIFVADEKGYFEDAGLKVTIELGGGDQNNTALLADQAQFTYTDLTGLLLDTGAGDINVGEFRALCAIHQTTLVAIVAPAASGIESPADLTGKRIGAFAGSPTEQLLPAYAAAAGWQYDPELIASVGIQELFTLLPSEQVDALSSFIIQRGVIAATAGLAPDQVVVFPFDEVLEDLLGTGLITTARLADENPDLVARFRDAALEGARYTIENADEAIQILADRNPGAVENVESFVAQIGIMTPYVTGRGEDQIGVMEEAQVTRCIRVLESHGLIASGLTPQTLIGEQTLLAGA